MRSCTRDGAGSRIVLDRSVVVLVKTIRPVQDDGRLLVLVGTGPWPVLIIAPVPVLRTAAADEVVHVVRHSVRLSTVPAVNGEAGRRYGVRRGRLEAQRGGVPIAQIASHVPAFESVFPIANHQDDCQSLFDDGLLAKVTGNLLMVE